MPLEGWIDRSDKRIYVWFDAVVGYLSASIEWARRSGDPEAWRQWWQTPDSDAYYFMGKDNIVFHSEIWPAQLLGYNGEGDKGGTPGYLGRLNLPTEVVSSEFLTMEGRKFSSSRQVVIYVRDFLARYDADALRYFIAVAGPENQDTDFTWAEFRRRNNDELVAGWGNLVNRSVSMAAKNVGAVPTPGELTDADRALLATTSGAFGPVGDMLSRNRQKAAINEAMRVVGEANKYLSDQAPWKLKEDPARRDTVLHTALQAIKDCNALLTPFLPHSSQQVHELLGGTGVWSVAPRDPRGDRPRRRLAVPDHHRSLRPGAGGLGVDPARRARYPAGPPEADLHQAGRIGRRRGAPASGGGRGMSRSASSRANRRGDPPPAPEPFPPRRWTATPTSTSSWGSGRPATSTGNGRRTTTSTPRSPPRPRSTCPGWCRSGSTSPRPGGPRQLAARHSSVLAAVAMHPNEAGAGKATDDALAEIDRLAALPRVRAVGETGLDRYRTGPEGWAAQEASFRAHIRIAKGHGVALVIHDREAHAEILEVLDDEGAPEHTVFHCFSGDAAFAKSCVERGFVLSFAGTLTFGNAGYLREAAALTPVGQLLVETDSPFLTPMPHRGRPNSSRLVPLTVRALAEVTGHRARRAVPALTATANASSKGGFPGAAGRPWRAVRPPGAPPPAGASGGGQSSRGPSHRLHPLHRRARPRGPARPGMVAGCRPSRGRRGHGGTGRADPRGPRTLQRQAQHGRRLRRLGLLLGIAGVSRASSSSPRRRSSCGCRPRHRTAGRRAAGRGHPPAPTVEDRRPAPPAASG